MGARMVSVVWTGHHLPDPPQVNGLDVKVHPLGSGPGLARHLAREVVTVAGPDQGGKLFFNLTLILPHIRY